MNEIPAADGPAADRSAADRRAGAVPVLRVGDRPSVESFWQSCRAAVPGLPEAAPEAWAFGGTPEQADELLALVLTGTKTATASSLRDYEHEGEDLPAVGQLGIVLDGADVPRALIEVTAVTTTPFDQVTSEHAVAEGEGDRSLAYWRQEHERFWREHSADPRGFTPDMPVVCERFRLLAVS